MNVRRKIAEVITLVVITSASVRRSSAGLWHPAEPLPEGVPLPHVSVPELQPVVPGVLASLLYGLRRCHFPESIGRCDVQDKWNHGITGLEGRPTGEYPTVDRFAGGSRWVFTFVGFVEGLA